jgi:hypothetical protein
MFTKISGQKHLNKRKREDELSHVKPVKSMMIGAM